jgi:hypothetical protein
VNKDQCAYECFRGWGDEEAEGPGYSWPSGSRADVLPFLKNVYVSIGLGCLRILVLLEDPNGRVFAKYGILCDENFLNLFL